MDDGKTNHLPRSLSRTVSVYAEAPLPTGGGEFRYLRTTRERTGHLLQLPDDDEPVGGTGTGT